MCAIPERLRGVFTTRRYTNPRFLPFYIIWNIVLIISNLMCHTYIADIVVSAHIVSYHYLEIVIV